ncbi:FAD-dependent oxidoreductase [Streptomyces sp. OF3]|uniref:FAD-dependent oxidoreductase n=1 Tax=Streptomyces alkaliterrae TaxID=2213162 RepID=A0A7W3WGJ4_9ACTN|nr:FAD-dependent oxidoreductase [Streptomyces alkaliterrae]MBB1251903.1 FAD-dependent oxidoreductase [Streptomyces alkaliterrae]
MAAQRRRVAVIGAGVAGLTAAHVLRRECEVWLYEADTRLGGHAHTHDVTGSDGRTHRVDSGFIVHNRRTYPTLLRLFDELGVDTQESEMSMSVRCEGCDLEYAGARGPAGLFARPTTSLRPRALRMFAEVPLFHRRARALLRRPAPAPEEAPRTLGAFLDAGGFSPYFRRHFVAPLVAAVWSCPARTALDYPAEYLFRFLDNHGMLSVTGSPRWRTVTGGSREYVRRAAERLHTVRAAAPVRTVRRFPGGAEVVTESDESRTFDGVVIAVHPDQALRLLADATATEKQVLGAFRYSRNPTVLHTDTSVLPRSRRAHASWNYLMADCDDGDHGVRISYDMNRLQRLDAADRYLVTLGAADRVDRGRVLAEMVYEHPVYTVASVAAQRRLPELDSAEAAFAGAYHGWGFHEDGCASGVRAAGAMGVRW